MFDFWSRKSENNNKKGASYWLDEYDVDYESIDAHGPALTEFDVAARESRDLYKMAGIRRAIANFVHIVTNKPIPVKYATKDNSYTNGKQVVLSGVASENFDAAVGLALHEGSHIVLSDFGQLALIKKVYLDLMMGPLRDSQEDGDWARFDRDVRFAITKQVDEHNANARLKDSGLKFYGEVEVALLNKLFKTENGLARFVTKGYDFHKLVKAVQNLTNWIEDRRIDTFIYNSAPGYREYYKAMYAHYFESKAITKGIESDSLCREDVRSYMFRIVNILNSKTDLNKLKRLKEIHQILDLDNISRLKDSWHSLELALVITDIIYTSMEENRKSGLHDKQADSKDDSKKQQKQQQQKQQQQQSNSSNDDEEESEEEGGDGQTKEQASADDEDAQIDDSGDPESTGTNGNDEDDDLDPDADAGSSIDDFEGEDEESQSKVGEGDSDETGSTKMPDMDDDIEGESSEEDSDEDKDLLSSNQIKQLEKAMRKQEEFLDNQVDKKTIKDKEQRAMNTIEESGTKLERVGQEFETVWGGKTAGVDCVVVPKVTQALMESEAWPYRWYSAKDRVKAVEDGIRMGHSLGNKLQARSESRETVFNRLKAGKIDGRMIATLGFGNEGVFYTKEVDKYKPVNLHISIDYSGSMAGTALCKAITATVAIAKACIMARNINVQVSIRSTVTASSSDGRYRRRRYSSATMPHIAIIYDSKRDSFKHLCKVLEHCEAAATTPEGLAFEAILDYMIPATRESESYFLNMSDGEPAFADRGFSYQGRQAAEHTYKQIHKMELSGIKVLSYFIGSTDTSGMHVGYSGYSSRDIFKLSYGNAAKFITVTNLTDIARTMNELFLRK